jgi:phage protein D
MGGVMKNLPPNPHAIIEISRPDATSGPGRMVWDSWEHKRLFKRVEVELVTNETSQVQWVFFDPEFKVIDAFAAASPVPMATVRVFLGYGQELGPPVFKGLLAEVSREDGSTTFTAFDMGFKMKLQKKAGYKNKKDDLAILKDLAVRNGLKFEGPEKPLQLEPHKSMMQDEQTDWEHVLERAHDAGLMIFVRQDTLFAKYPAKSGKPVLTFRNNKDQILTRDWEFTFHTPEHQDGRPRVVKHRGRGRAGKRAEGQSDEGSRGRESVVLKRDAPGLSTKSKLSKRAQAQKELEREHAFQGRVSGAFPIDGERLDVRNTIMVNGVGKLFSGKYICDRVMYRLEPGRFAVDLDVYRDIAV